MAGGRDERFNERLRQVRQFEGGLPGFDPDDASEHPARLFMEWLGSAIDAGVREPHVMTRATVDADGRPSARSLILRGLDDGRWSFGTSRTSRKGVELAAAPWAAATFCRSALGRQVRLPRPPALRAARRPLGAGAAVTVGAARTSSPPIACRRSPRAAS